jgi:hypothetical protein
MGRDIQAKVIASRKSEFRTMVGVVSSVRIWCFCCGEKERRLNVEDGIEAEFWGGKDASGAMKSVAILTEADFFNGR